MLVSPVFAAAAVEYGIIGSKAAPGAGLGNALNKKFSQVSEKMSPAAPSSRSRPPRNVAGKVKAEESKPITLVPTTGGAVDQETGMFYNDEGGGYYNPETTTFVIHDSSVAKSLRIRL